VAAALLQLSIMPASSAVLTSCPADVLADIGVLAEHAAQVAAGKEDRPRAAPAAQGAFLPGMGAVAAHPGMQPGLADAQFTLGAVHTATQWADMTGFQVCIRSINARLECSAFHQG
jgi:hypothetical protein